MTSVGGVAADDRVGLLDKERIIAPADYNRWLVPPAALAIHLCIGMAYGFSVFWVPLGRALGVAAGTGKPIVCPGDATTFFGKVAITAHALFATDCDWTQFDLGWMFTLFFVLLGTSAALWGVLAGLLVAGFVANLLIRPLDKKWFMKDEEVKALQAAEARGGRRQASRQSPPRPEAVLT